MISSSIEKLFIFSIFFHSFSFFLQKPVHYFIIHRKILHMSTKTFILSKTEQNYFFHRILFSEHWSNKSFQYPFCSLSSKLFRKFKFVLYGQIVQKVQRVQGVQGVQIIFLFSLSVLFSFSILVKVYLRAKYFSFHYHFIFISILVKVYLRAKYFSFHYHFYFHFHSRESVFTFIKLGAKIMYLKITSKICESFKIPTSYS